MASNFSVGSAEGYEQLMGRWSSQMAQPFIAFSGFDPGEAVLDVGCGTGSLTFALADFGGTGQIVGIDVSRTYLDFAKARVTDQRIKFLEADAAALPYPEASFDRALALLSLQFLPDPLLGVLEMRRVVKRGGTLAACVWDSFGGMPHMRMLWDTASALGMDRQRTLLRPLSTDGEMASMWQKAGLQNIATDAIHTKFRFECFDEYWGTHLSGDGPSGQMVMGLAEHDRARLKEQSRHAYLSNKPDGPRSFFATAWVCKGIVP